LKPKTSQVIIGKLQIMHHEEMLLQLYHVETELSLTEERKAESVLLEERWTLMQPGFDRKRIKLAFLLTMNFMAIIKTVLH